MSVEAKIKALEPGFDELTQAIIDAGRIALSGHTDPDGDALGSVLALALFIQKTWPHKQVDVLLANKRPVPRIYAFLPEAGSFINAADYSFDPDLFIALDTPTLERLRDSAEVLERASMTAAIDHHATSMPFTRVYCCEPGAASTADIVYEYIRYFGAPLDADIATCLLCAVITDTGRFQYQNANAHAYALASACVTAGAQASYICTQVYQNDTLASLQLKAATLQRLTVNADHTVSWSYVTHDDLVQYGATDEDCEGLIDEIRVLGGVDACVFMREKHSGEIRANLRSKVDWLDVAAVAQQFNGGGHKAAAGFTCYLPMAEACETVVRAIEAQIAKQKPKDNALG